MHRNGELLDDSSLNSDSEILAFDSSDNCSEYKPSASEDSDSESDARSFFPDSEEFID